MAKFEKGHIKKGGRKKGSQNELTKQMKSVKQTILEAFNKLQENTQTNIISFAKKYPKEFHLIASKLIPTEIEAKVEDNRKNIADLFPEILKDGKTDK